MHTGEEKSWKSGFAAPSCLQYSGIWIRQPYIVPQRKAEEHGLKLGVAEEVLSALEAVVKTAGFPFSNFFKQRSFYAQTCTLGVIKVNFSSQLQHG